MREFPVNLFGGNGHSANVGTTRDHETSDLREKCFRRRDLGEGIDEKLSERFRDIIKPNDFESESE